MTEHSKPTPGACRVFDNPTSNYGLEVRSDVPVKAKQVICRFGGPDRASNANLVAEAFNVLHETGLTPRELADRLAQAEKQRDELLAALREARDALNGAPNTVGLHQQINAAIAKVPA